MPRNVHLCRDGIRERELAATNVHAHVHSDGGEFVAVVMDHQTFENVRRILARETVLGRLNPTPNGTPSHMMRGVRVNLSVD